MKIRILILLAVFMPCGTASAQFYSGDARKIAIGGIGYSDNIAEDFIEQEEAYPSVVLPVHYTGHAGYTRNRTTVAARVSHGFQGTAVHCGAEYRLGLIDVRGVLRYALDKWHPTTGIGLNLGRTFSIDAGAFWNTTNIERAYRPNLAVSLRFNKPSDSGHKAGSED